MHAAANGTRAPSARTRRVTIDRRRSGRTARSRTQIAARAPARRFASSARGTWLDAGRPCAAAAASRLGALTRHHALRAGRPHAHRARRHDARRDRARDCAPKASGSRSIRIGIADGTIGATIATASAGPLASAFGTPRDLVLGCEFVTRHGRRRARGRTCREERRRLRSHAPPHRRVGNARRASPKSPCACARAPRSIARSPCGGDGRRTSRGSWLRAERVHAVRGRAVSAALATQCSEPRARRSCSFGSAATQRSCVPRGRCGGVRSATPREVDDDGVGHDFARREPPTRSSCSRSSTLPSRIGALWDARSGDRGACWRLGARHACRAASCAACIPATDDDEQIERSRGHPGSSARRRDRRRRTAARALWACARPHDAADERARRRQSVARSIQIAC